MVRENETMKWKNGRNRGIESYWRRVVEQQNFHGTLIVYVVCQMHSATGQIQMNTYVNALFIYTFRTPFYVLLFKQIKPTTTTITTINKQVNNSFEVNNHNNNNNKKDIVI